jgi:hypothetical protein
MDPLAAHSDCSHGPVALTRMLAVVGMEVAGFLAPFFPGIHNQPQQNGIFHLRNHQRNSPSDSAHRSDWQGTTVAVAGCRHNNCRFELGHNDPEGPSIRYHGDSLEHSLEGCSEGSCYADFRQP